MPTLEEVTGSLNAIMGVKAVWGRSAEAIMCFGSRGDPAKKDRAHFMLAHGVAGKAMERPHLITIGGGEFASPDLDGRVLELVRVTGVYGETNAFVRDPELYRRPVLAPVATNLS